MQKPKARINYAKKGPSQETTPRNARRIAKKEMSHVSEKKIADHAKRVKK